eukprot:01388_2
MPVPVSLRLTHGSVQSNERIVVRASADMSRSSVNHGLQPTVLPYLPYHDTRKVQPRSKFCFVVNRIDAVKPNEFMRHLCGHAILPRLEGVILLYQVFVGSPVASAGMSPIERHASQFGSWQDIRALFSRLFGKAICRVVPPALVVRHHMHVYERRPTLSQESL